MVGLGQVMSGWFGQAMVGLGPANGRAWSGNGRAFLGNGLAGWSGFVR